MGISCVCACMSIHVCTCTFMHADLPLHAQALCWTNKSRKFIKNTKKSYTHIHTANPHSINYTPLLCIWNEGCSHEHKQKFVPTVFIIQSHTIVWGLQRISDSWELPYSYKINDPSPSWLVQFLTSTPYFSSYPVASSLPNSQSQVPLLDHHLLPLHFTSPPHFLILTEWSYMLSPFSLAKILSYILTHLSLSPNKT
jgi:hypothetical protein